MQKTIGEWFGDPESFGRLISTHMNELINANSIGSRIHCLSTQQFLYGEMTFPKRFNIK